MDKKENMDEKENNDKIEKIVDIILVIVLIVMVLMAPLAIMPPEYVHNLFSMEGLISYIWGFMLFPLPQVIVVYRWITREQ